MNLAGSTAIHGNAGTARILRLAGSTAIHGNAGTARILRLTSDGDGGIYLPVGWRSSAGRAAHL